VTDALTLEALATLVSELVRDVAALKSRVEALAQGQGAPPMSIGGPMPIAAGQSSTVSIQATVGTPPVPTTNLPAVPVWSASNPAAILVTPSADNLTAVVTVVAGFAPGDGGNVHLAVGPLVDDLAVTVVAVGAPVADKVQIAFTAPA
jgi:hypothetical protein